MLHAAHVTFCGPASFLSSSPGALRCAQFYWLHNFSAKCCSISGSVCAPGAQVDSIPNGHIVSFFVGQLKASLGSAADFRVSTRPGSTAKRGLRSAFVSTGHEGQARGAIVPWFSGKPSIESEKRFEDEGLSMEGATSTRVIHPNKLSDHRAANRDAPCQLRPKITSDRNKRTL